MTGILLVFSFLFSLALAYDPDFGSVCGVNEESHICGRMCEPTCSNRTPKFCPRIQCTDGLTRNCRCETGYFRDTQTMMCVPPELCPDSTDVNKHQVCRENEQLGSCARICEGTCKNPNKEKCAATMCAGSGCQCKPGYLRDEATDRCVLASHCPKKCDYGEVSAACGRTCEGNCKSPVTPEICSRIRCANWDCRCDLNEGFVRSNVTGRCVQINQCKNDKPKCPANSERKLCGSICEPTCRDPRERLCKIDSSKCTVDCRCSKGYVRNEETNECVRPECC